MFNLKRKIFTGIILFSVLIISPLSVFADNLNTLESPPLTSIIVKYKNKIDITSVPIPQGVSLSVFLKKFNNDPIVEYAEPNYIYQSSMIPDDSKYDEQWYLKRIKAPDAWNFQSTSPSVVIAIIDSGVQIQHPDLRNNIWFNADEIEGNKKDDDHNGLVDDRYGWDFINNSPDPSPKFKTGFTEAGILHGTIVAGIAAATGNNQEGIAGVSWQARIMSLKALDDAGNGDTASVVRSIDYAIAKGANIINLSFVSYSYTRSLRDAVQRAYDANIAVVAPAGNEQSAGHGVNLNTKPIYPACYKNLKNEPIVIGVAATDGIDQKAVFSGFGNNCISLSAPGVGFYSTGVFAPTKSINGKFFNSYYDGYWSGTSVAVPLVSGTLALIQSVNPTLTTKQGIEMLLNTTDNINALNPTYVGQLGRGRINVSNAVLGARALLFNKEARLIIAPINKAEPFAKITDIEGNILHEFLMYDREFRGGVSITSGDLNNDGNAEIITAPANQLESDIKIFDQNGKFIRHFLAYPATFQGGVNVTTADLNSDGKYEIITAPARGLRSDIKIFDGQGKLLKSFLAYPASFTGGASVAVGDVMGTTTPEIVVGTAKGGIPQVKIFSNNGVLRSSFLVGKKTEATGLRISLLDIDGNVRRRQSEILITRQNGSADAVITDYTGNVRKRWAIFPTSFKGDVQTVTADINNDGSTDIVAFPGEGGGPHLRFFNRLGELINSFYAYSPDFNGGVQVALMFIKR